MMNIIKAICEIPNAPAAQRCVAPEEFEQSRARLDALLVVKRQIDAEIAREVDRQDFF